MLRITGRFISRLSLNGIIGGVLRCQRFYSQPSRVTTHVCTQWLFNYNNGNALSREIELIATSLLGGFIQPERLLLGILVTILWVEG